MIVFENADYTRPVYIGGMYSKGAEYHKTQGISDNNSEIYKSSKGKKYRPLYQDDIPKEAYYNTNSNYPTKKIIYKSPKGATILIDEKDEGEHLTLIDRVGQVFSMFSPTTLFNNMNNGGARRLLSTLSKYNTFDKSYIKDKTIIILKSITNSIFRIVSSKTGSKIDLVSRSEDKSSGISIEVDESNNHIKLFVGESIIQIKENDIFINSNNINLNSDTINFNTRHIHYRNLTSSSSRDGYRDIVDKWVDSEDEFSIS